MPGTGNDYSQSNEDKDNHRAQSRPPITTDDDDSSTVGDDFSDASSIASIQDTNSLGWSYYRVTEETTTVLEGWEMLYVRPTNEPRSRTQILGFNVKTTSVAARDGYTGVRAVPYYTQDELGRMVNEDQEAFDKSCSKCGFLRTENKPSSYTEDLTTRLFALPGCLANRLGALLDTRHSATNKSPFVRREWKVVLLRPMENPISGGSHKDQAKSPKRHFGRGRSQKNDPVQKWLIVIRGQVTMTSQDGFLTYDTSSNPWLKADELAQQRHHEKRGLPRTHP